VSEAGRAHHLPTIALVRRDDELPHLFTPYPEGAPPEIDADHLHAELCPELAEGVREMARKLRDLLGFGAGLRIGVDEYTAAMYGLRTELFAAPEAADASLVLTAARVTKTPDEIECIRRAQQINELAMHDVQAALRPGVRQSDLTGIFLRRITALGASFNLVDPIWQLVPPSAAVGPCSVTGEVAFPLVSTDRAIAEREVIWVDTGIGYEGYASDFGRTWIVSREPHPTARQADQFHRWREVLDRSLEAVRPGATAFDLTRAAIAAHRATGGEGRPWLRHLYLAHGVGLDSAEMPLVGTDLGDEFDAGLVLAEGMVLVFEPIVWDEGAGGYRGEEVVVVTGSGYRQLSDYPYQPFAEV
jgi:Xaa-Pro aminopeptidase